MSQRTKPPFRADHVGSLLRPAALKAAREKRAKGEIGDAELKAVEDREIKDVIGKQEAAGLQSITDGEFRRSWWHLDFLWGLDGVEKHVMDSGIAFAAVTTRNEGVKVTGKIGFSGHPMVDHFKFLKVNTTRTPKMTIPAPSALYGRPLRTPVDKSIYPSLDGFFADLGEAYKKAVHAFADAGCRYLQLDEVFIAMLCDPHYRAQMKDRGDDPEALGTIYGDLINTAISDIPADMTVTMHLCRGNYKSTFMGTGGYDAMQEVLFDRIKVHGYFMEYDSARAGGFEPLRRLQKGRMAVLGLVTTKTGALESKDAVKRRIEEAAKFAPLDQLCLSPQCGFASTEEGNILGDADQWAKLRMIGETAREVWGRERMRTIVAGKVAIVTGAGRGIGRGIALLMAAEGARVVVCDIGASLDGGGTDAVPAQAVVEEIEKAGGKAIASTLSISAPGNADKIVQAALDAFGRVDILVNNAGILRDRIFHRMSWSDWSDVIDVHLHGSFLMSRACATHFREQNSGSFVHMTSTSGLVGNFGQANYMAAKMAIVGLSRGIALDMARFGVRSNCVAPFAWTRMIDSIPAETDEEKARVAAFREMTPEKIAPLVVYLGSDRAEGISGQIFSVRNNEIYLFNQTRPIRTLQRSDGWTPERLDAQLKGAFAASFTPLDRSSDVFSWDPV